MSATAEAGGLTSFPEKLGIVAGGGSLPALLVTACAAKECIPVVAGLKGFAADSLSDQQFRPGQASAMIQYFKDEGVQDLVLIGQVTRPSLWALRPDWRTFLFFMRLGFRRLGDNSLLSAVRSELEREGFNLHGIHHFLPELLAPKGVIGTVQPSEADLVDIKFGFEASQFLGKKDKGQAVIVQDQNLIDEEDKSGTRALILRNKGGVLVKSCKPQQDMSLDLPTVGPDTVRQAYSVGVRGIAVHAGKSLITDKAEVISLADQHGIFVVGVDG